MYHQRFKSIKERFEEKYEVKPSGCWEWKTGDGYPRFWTGRGHKKAYRYIWETVHKVTLNSKQCVCHRCDNSLCVNPEHLFIGTQQDNIRDMIEKNRKVSPIGSRNGRTRLKIKTVRQIRKLFSVGNISQQKLADRFDISQTVVSLIIRRKIWRHVDG